MTPRIFSVILCFISLHAYATQDKGVLSESPRFVELPDVMILEMIQFLNVSDKLSFQETNKNFWKHADLFLAQQDRDLTFFKPMRGRVYLPEEIKEHSLDHLRWLWSGLGVYHDHAQDSEALQKLSMIHHVFLDHFLQRVEPKDPECWSKTQWMKHAQAVFFLESAWIGALSYGIGESWYCGLQNTWKENLRDAISFPVDYFLGSLLNVSPHYFDRYYFERESIRSASSYAAIKVVQSALMSSLYDTYWDVPFPGSWKSKTILEARLHPKMIQVQKKAQKEIIHAMRCDENQKDIASLSGSDLYRITEKIVFLSFLKSLTASEKETSLFEDIYPCVKQEIVLDQSAIFIDSTRWDIIKSLYFDCLNKEQKHFLQPMIDHLDRLNHHIKKMPEDASLL